jgi:RND family efflux transporter MFP subunit
MARHRMKKIHQRATVAAAAGLSLLAVSAVSCSGSSAKNVVVSSAGPKTLSLNASGLGQVSAATDIAVQTGFRAQVDSVVATPGEAVTKGQVLLTLSPSALQLQLQQTSVRLAADTAAAAQAAATLASDQVARPARVLADQTLVSAEQSRVTLDQQLLAIAQGRAGAITAPITGVVAAVNATPGQYVSGAASLVEIVDYSKVMVKAILPVADQANVHEGAPASITVGTIGSVTLDGTVTAVSPVATNAGQGFQVAVEASNTPDERVRPGLTASVDVPVQYQAPVAVSRLAVLQADTNPLVFVVNRGIAHQRRVVIGATDGNSIEVVSGLHPGDVCVIAGNQSLADGTKVVVSSNAS